MLQFSSILEARTTLRRTSEKEHVLTVPDSADASLSRPCKQLEKRIRRKKKRSPHPGSSNQMRRKPSRIILDIQRKHFKYDINLGKNTNAGFELHVPACSFSRVSNTNTV